MNEWIDGLVLVGIPLAFLFALASLAAPSKMILGLVKTLTGMGLLVLVLPLVDDLSPTPVFYAGMALTTALLGFVDLVVAKVSKDRQQHVEPALRGGDGKNAPDA